MEAFFDRIPVVFTFPTGLLILIAFVLAGLTWHLFDKMRKSYGNSIHRSSIKESIDNLPAGLSFCTPDGRVLLANRRMESLCHGITGRNLQDGKQFWETLQTETTAADTTRLYAMSEELKDNNRKLKSMNRRLKEYGENMESLVREKEILETKMRIHRDMGQALLASRAYLLEKSSGFSEKEIMKQWQYVTALLKKEAEPREDQGTWKAFLDAAVLAGAKVQVEGEMPQKEESARLITAAAAEALTNAVRHASADELYVKLEMRGKELRAIFTNNGQDPEGAVLEGGGLGALRIRLEEAGGSMEIKTIPHFALMITLPAKGEINAEKCSDCGR